MWKIRYGLAALGFGLTVAACSIGVVTQKPLFSANDAAIAQFKLGVWSVQASNCDRPEGSSEKQECSGEILITSSTVEPARTIGKEPARQAQQDDKRLDYILAGGGDPSMLQVRLVPSAAEPARTIGKEPARQAQQDDKRLDYILAGGGDPSMLQVRLVPSAAEPGMKSAVMYVYAAVSALDKNADGRITKAEIWPVECGEPEPAKPGDTPLYPRLKSRIPGLRDVGSVCTPEDADALRRAATATRSWSKNVIQANWERDAPAGANR